MCDRCQEEAKAMTEEEKNTADGETGQKDESKVEASLNRYEEFKGGDQVE